MMISRTTRNPPSRVLRYFVAATFAMATAAHAASVDSAARAWGPEFKLELVSAQSDIPALPPDLVVSAEWPDSCLPQLLRSSMVDGHIDVELRSTGHDCVKAPTPMSLRFNPSREAGQMQMPVGVYEVRFYLARDNGFSELIAFNLLRAGWRDSSFRPESGFWWSVSNTNRAFLAGSGLSIEQQGETLAVTLLSYEAGNAVWYFGNARAAGTLARVPLVRMFGGDSPFSAVGTPPQVEAALTLDLNFLSPSRASAWLTRPFADGREGIEIQSLDLLRLPFAGNANGAAWKGQWVLIGEESRQAAVFDLGEVATSGAGNFTLRSRADGAELQCRLEDFGEHSVPTFCSLLDGNELLADFDKIGLDRLIGRNPEGQNMRLVRLPR